jgi:hypothetical protein
MVGIMLCGFEGSGYFRKSLCVMKMGETESGNRRVLMG